MLQICETRNHYVNEEKTNEITTDSAVIKIIMFIYKKNELLVSFSKRKGGLHQLQCLTH